MPSSTPKQEKFMRAVAHGWHPDQFKGPSQAVAREFMQADQAKKQHAVAKKLRSKHA